MVTGLLSNDGCSAERAYITAPGNRVVKIEYLKPNLGWKTSGTIVLGIHAPFTINTNTNKKGTLSDAFKFK